MPSVSQIPIRPERPDDLESIRKVFEQAFPTPLESELVIDLRRAGRLTLSLVAEWEESVVGAVAFSPVTINGEVSGWGLAPVGVLPEFQSRGVGSALIRKGLDCCKQRQVPWVVVLGAPGYYRRFGFLPARDFGLQDTYGGGEAFQVWFPPGSRPEVPPGVVEYAPEFARFE